MRQGDLTSVLLLTGELEAASSEPLVVPTTPSWQIQLRWLAEDGIEVAAGDRVAEFDSGDLTRQVADAKLELAQVGDELAQLAAEAAQVEAEKRFAVAEARSRLAAAELDADVPSELLAARTYQDRQLGLARARAALEKSERALVLVRLQAETDRAIAELKREKTGRALRAAAAALSSLVARAPRAGVFVVSRHPWEGRKVQVGDSLYPGAEVGSIPDLASLRVRAAVFDVDGGRVTGGLEGSCALEAFASEETPCRVVELSPVAREAERQSLRRVFTARLALARVDAGRMRPGQSVKVALTVGRVTGSILAPRAGLDLAGDPPRARLAAGGLRPVRVGPCDALDCVVEDGLVQGELLAGEERE